jgi:hypothetical protein
MCYLFRGISYTLFKVLYTTKNRRIPNWGRVDFVLMMKILLVRD